MTEATEDELLDDSQQDDMPIHLKLNWFLSRVLPLVGLKPSKFMDDDDYYTDE